MDPCSMLVPLSGQDCYRREPEVPAYRLVVRRSFSVHLRRSTRLPFEPFRPHFCSHELLCPMANCSCAMLVFHHHDVADR